MLIANTTLTLVYNYKSQTYNYRFRKKFKELNNSHESVTKNCTKNPQQNVIVTRKFES